MMRLYDAIESANREGRLGLIIYPVPYFPDPSLYSETLSLLSETPFVTGIETTIPVRNGFSEHANEIIRRAHLSGSVWCSSPGQVFRGMLTTKPSICVLYRETAEAFGIDEILDQADGTLNGLLLEWSEPSPEAYQESCSRHGVEWIECVGPWMTASEIARRLAPTGVTPIVYLMSAPMTGAKLYENVELAETARHVKCCVPKAKVAAGFGVRTPADIARLKATDSIDAVIVGSEFLRRMAEGLPAVTHYLGSLEGAL